MSQAEVLALIKQVAQAGGVDPCLAAAIAQVETRLNPVLTRFEPNWNPNCYYEPDAFAARLSITQATERVHQATSWGPMQIMGAVAREFGYQDHLPLLASNAEVAARFSCKKISELVKKYGDEPRVIAAYNAGSPRRRIPDNQFVNQDYVDKVSACLKGLRAL